MFPKLNGDGTGMTGWKAVLVVRSDALSVMNAYAGQAADKGFRQVSNPAPHCWSPEDGEVFCKGFYVRDDAFLGIDVHVCRACRPSGSPQAPVSEAQLDYALTPGAPYGELEPIAPPTAIASGGTTPSSTPNVKLTSLQYRQMLRLPGRGAAAQGFDLRASLLVAPATSFANCQTDLVGVVSGANLHGVVSPPRSGPTTIDGSTVTAASDGNTIWTLVERDDLPAPVLLSDSCGD